MRKCGYCGKVFKGDRCPDSLQHYQEIDDDTMRQEAEMDDRRDQETLQG